MSKEISKEAIDEKNRMRLALRNEYLKKVTSPAISENGHIFDAAIQRFLTLKVTKISFFKETPTTIMRGLALVVIPLGLLTYFLKQHRDEREARFRAGEVSYRDRHFKFV